MTLRESIDLLDKHHACGICDEDIAWDHVKNRLTQFDEKQLTCNGCKHSKGRYCLLGANHCSHMAIDCWEERTDD